MEARGGRELGSPKGSVTPADALKGALPVCLRSQACPTSGLSRPQASCLPPPSLGSLDAERAVGCWVAVASPDGPWAVRWLSRLLTCRLRSGSVRRRDDLLQLLLVRRAELSWAVSVLGGPSAFPFCS